MIKSGIYTILNITNNKFYVGSAKYFNSRWGQHKYQLRLNNHHNIHLQRSWNKHGEEKFLFQVLEYVEDITKLGSKEQYWISKLNPIFNLKTFVDGFWIYPEESRKKMSAWQVGRKMSDEAKLRMSIAAKGNQNAKGTIYTEEFKENCRKRQLGKKLSSETKKKMSIARKGNKSHTGRKFTEQHIQNLKKARKNYLELHQ